MTAFKTNKKVSVEKLKRQNDHLKRTKGSQISKKMKKKGLTQFTVGNIAVWALNWDVAKKKIKKIQQSKK